MCASRTTCLRCVSRVRSTVPPTYKSAFRVGAGARPVAWFSSTAPGASHQTPSSSSTSQPPFPQEAPASSKRQPRRTKDADAAVSLFNDVVQKNEATARGGSPARPIARQHSAPAVLGEWEIAAKMKELETMNVETLDRLRLFQNEIWPHVKELRGRIPKHLYVSTTTFLAQTCDAVAQQGLTGISVALSKMLAIIGKWDLHMRNQLVLSLCHTLISRKHTSAERNALVDELLDMWRHTSQLRRMSQLHVERLTFVLPTKEEIVEDIEKCSASSTRQNESAGLKSSNMTPTTKALASIFTQYRLEQAGELVPGLLTTLAVLSDPRLAREASQIKAAPLLDLVALALQHQPADAAHVDGIFSRKIEFPPSKLADLRSYVLPQWPRAQDMVLRTDAAWREGSIPSQGPSRSSSEASHLSVFNKQLRSAYRSRNTGAVVSIWQDLKACLAQNRDIAREMREDPDFFDYWIFVWCAVRRPTMLQATLDLMREVGIQPTVRSYTNMMYGWKICKDADRIEALWNKLVQSGLRLDVFIWTERISGLIEAGRPQSGIQALAEMQSLWKKAVASRGSIESAARVAVQPSTEVVNAALKGLIVLDRRAANEVLVWAGRQGIEPNVRTYNVLLRESLRNNVAEDVQGLLKAMKNRGIEIDSATFTILLEGLLGSLEHASAAEQVHVARQILGDIEAAGLKANHETYGKMLYAVSGLANGGANEALAAVQDHMTAAGLSITPHMVTILIERVISRDPLPPDAGAAVRAILKEHGLSDVAQGDQTLWERVMSAHAVTGDVASAMAVFDDLARAGRPVTSLPCLTDLLKALLASADPKAAQDARHVVGVVLHHRLEGAAADDSSDRDARYWKHHFWFLARENGLVDWRQVPVTVAAKLRE
ncbi:glutathione S-transferase [Metarhizium album ARSEF 1941]|uniref:Glutathione S-transferase n=1 Tax=Metarhizium album (strain ARSEF 1941) TaxID=1081103 RepID=A0A0B2WW21_METAS|nr:glutathione S-transferase [Metarhizium album ARSEF 1941]KHN97652.1 glutathione S-transferase [Metarhizium album ARSEF 1941]